MFHELRGSDPITMNTLTIIPIRAVCRAFVAVPYLDRQLTVADLEKIQAAIPPEFYEVVSIEPMPTFEVPEDHPGLEDMPKVELEAAASPPQSIAARAREIGISEPTLHRWRKEIDIFDDDAVRSLVASRRSHLWKVADKFKTKLTTTSDPV